MVMAIFNILKNQQRYLCFIHNESLEEPTWQMAEPFRIFYFSYKSFLKDSKRKSSFKKKTKRERP